VATTRRNFLKSAAGALALLGFGCGSGGGGSRGPSSTGDPGNPGPDPTTTPPTTPPANPPPDNPPPAMLTGRIVRPGDADYDLARANYNGRFSLHPQLLCFAATADDVANAIRWAREKNVPLRVRSGRHSYEAYSLVDDGLVLDVSALNGVALDAAAGTARIGPGCTLMALTEQLFAGRMGLPTGSCNSLGIAGVALGGGVGLSSRKYGLTCDRLTGADVVTADGKLVRASATQNADLYWALRGGGGGNFGVVTSFDFSVVPVGDVATYTVGWPIADFPAVMAAWQSWAPYTDPGLVSSLSVDKNGVYSLGQFAGTTDDLNRLIQPLVSVGSPRNLVLRSRSFLDAQRDFGEDSADMHPKFKNSSAYFKAALPDAAIQAILTQLAAAPGPSNTLQFDALGGAVASVAIAATAFAHRAALFSGQYEAFWSSDADEPRNRDWIGATRRALLPYSDGAYVNYCDADISDFAPTYYGANLAQLQMVKHTYDPDRFFSFAQAIPK